MTYVDYGNSETLKKPCIVELPEDLQRPGLASKFRLWGLQVPPKQDVTPFDQVKWDIVRLNSITYWQTVLINGIHLDKWKSSNTRRYGLQDLSFQLKVLGITYFLFGIQLVSFGRRGEGPYSILSGSPCPESLVTALAHRTPRLQLIKHCLFSLECTGKPVQYLTCCSFSFHVC